ncbi:amidohydrolase 2 [Novosphingobium sp. Rr 2-17]|uniref:amidohydrolase family protein n=1 Tax=Novosphingobium sp. Rr 2-17 TaxID=555793 RepID=UPI0002698582|nr:amidohydrolase family protein [Novosphingobium sp. Rr 2-17]EIZ77742.1 amidohydrolase 2 [Novosphingobium sp. Rr 2-17]
MRIVDAQVHLWENPGAPPIHGPSFTYQQALTGMDEAGIDLAINCPPIWDPAAMAYSVEAHLAHPDRFVTHGWVDLLGPDASASLDATLALPGMVGMRFITASPVAAPGETNTMNRIRWPQDNSLDWFWERMAASGRPVAVCGGAILPHVDRVARRHPELKLIIDHFGASIMGPGLVQFDGLFDFAQLPNVAIKLTGGAGYFDEAYPMPSLSREVRKLYDAFGPNRLFWGTDFTRMRLSWRECLTLYTEEMDWLTDRDRSLIAGEGLLLWHGMAIDRGGAIG